MSFFSDGNLLLFTYFAASKILSQKEIYINIYIVLLHLCDYIVKRRRKVHNIIVPDVLHANPHLAHIIPHLQLFSSSLCTKKVTRTCAITSSCTTPAESLARQTNGRARRTLIPATASRGF